jgi:hypothetical protein
MLLIAFTARVVATYATTAAISALLQQVNGERLLVHPTTAMPKKHMTATFTEIDLTFNGIIS